MGNHNGDMTPGDGGSVTGRRDFLRRAAVAGSGAFAVPMIVTVDPADAQAVTSPPPEPPGSSVPNRPGVGRVNPARPGATGAGGVEQAGRRATPGRTELPRTGADIDRMVAAGLAATAGGAALVLWSADTQSRPGPESPSPGAADPETTT
jgi:hypothetical protein